MILIASALVTFALLSSAPPSHAPDRECIRQKLEPSLQVLIQMRAAGLDLSRPRPISQLFVGEDDALKMVGESLGASGYRVEETGAGRLLLATTSAVSEDWIRSMITQMCIAASSASVEYDGWDVDVGADNVPVSANK